MKKFAIYVEKSVPILVNPNTGRYYAAGDIIRDCNDTLLEVARHNSYALSIIEIDDEQDVSPKIQDKVINEDKVVEIKTNKDVVTSKDSVVVTKEAKVTEDVTMPKEETSNDVVEQPSTSQDEGTIDNSKIVSSASTSKLSYSTTKKYQKTKK